jgi:hypothetical protein
MNCFRSSLPVLVCTNQTVMNATVFFSTTTHIYRHGSQNMNMVATMTFDSGYVNICSISKGTTYITTPVSQRLLAFILQFWLIAEKEENGI